MYCISFQIMLEIKWENLLFAFAFAFACIFAYSWIMNTERSEIVRYAKW